MPVASGRSSPDPLERELSNLPRTFEELRSDMLPYVAGMLAKALQVLFAGFGAEAGAARIGRGLLGAGQDRAGELAATGPRDMSVLPTFEPRPRLLRALPSCAPMPRMRVVLVTDHAFQPQAERFSEVVLPDHVASDAPLPPRATMISLLRLLAVAFVARDAERIEHRIETLATIDES